MAFSTKKMLLILIAILQALIDHDDEIPPVAPNPSAPILRAQVFANPKDENVR